MQVCKQSRSRVSRRNVPFEPIYLGDGEKKKTRTETPKLPTVALPVRSPLPSFYAVMGKPNPSVSPPYISTKSKHFPYATHIAAGFSHLETCERLGIPSDTARTWRKRLISAGTAYFGRRVSYDFAARFAVDTTFRAEYERICRENEAQTPSSAP